MSTAPIRRWLLALAILSAFVLVPLRSAAQPSGVAAQPSGASERSWSFLGHARKIPRSWSASRDAPAFSLMLFPRSIRTAAGELAMFSLFGTELEFRTGFYGLIELENEGRTQNFDNLMVHATGEFFWRGSYGYYVAFAFPELAERLCPRCALETTLMYRHESEHVTASNHGGTSESFVHAPIIGDGFVLDVAASAYSGDFLGLARVQSHFFLPDHSSYGLGPGLELHARYTGLGRIHPFVSLFGEYLFGARAYGREYPGAYLTRALLGVALPSDLGNVMVHLSGDIGHRKGLLAYTEEATLGLGVRLALGAMP